MTKKSQAHSSTADTTQIRLPNQQAGVLASTGRPLETSARNWWKFCRLEPYLRGMAMSDSSTPGNSPGPWTVRSTDFKARLGLETGT